MKYRSLLKIHQLFLSALMIALALNAVAAPQKQKKIIYLFEADPSDEVLLEVLEIDVSGTPVTPGKPFESDENWIKHLRFKFKNVSDKPIVLFNFGGGILKGIDEKVEMGYSYKRGVVWRFGKYFDPKKEKRRGIVFQPGAITDLTYDQLYPLYKHPEAQKDQGISCKLEIGLNSIQFRNGALLNSGGIRYKPS